MDPIGPYSTRRAASDPVHLSSHSIAPSDFECYQDTENLDESLLNLRPVQSNPDGGSEPHPLSRLGAGRFWSSTHCRRSWRERVWQLALLKMQDSDLKRPTRDLLAESARWLEEQYPLNYDGISSPNKLLEQRKSQTRQQLERIRKEEGEAQLHARNRYSELDSYTIGPPELEDSNIYEMSASSPILTCPYEFPDWTKTFNDLLNDQSETDIPVDQAEEDQIPPSEQVPRPRLSNHPVNEQYLSPQTVHTAPGGRSDKKSVSWPLPRRHLSRNHMDSQNDRSSRYSSRSAPSDHVTGSCEEEAYPHNRYAEQNPQSVTDFSAPIPLQKSNRSDHQSLFAGLDRLIEARPARFPPRYNQS